MEAATQRLNSALDGRYRIERQLGAGGMATVYLAHDIKHERRVALKVLKPELAAVLGADRFVAEIRTTASLQHPHILPLFDSGSADGFLYYVMPYVEGETLRDKLNRDTQLGVDEAVRLAREIADALDYAHRHGVIHRDIKPENILLHDGRPVVADFGIALAVSAAAGGRMTETGLSLGTPHYMSPEQATADKDLTGRSDIYSLASVLYEMLTGQPPHTGASAQQIIMKIIAEPAEAVTRFRRAVPAHIAAAVGKALEKLPADRFESARAFADALGNPSFGTSSTPGTMFATSGARGVSMPAFAATAAIALITAVAAAWSWFGPEPPAEVSRFSIVLPDTNPLVTGRASRRLAIAPDGRSIVYAGWTGSERRDANLFLRAMDQLEVQSLPGTHDASNPAFSPDGRRIAFIAGTPRAVKVISLGGGPAVTLTDSLVDAGGLTWSDDGYIYYDGHLEGDGIARIRASGGKPEIASRPLESESWHAGPSALPGGHGILFMVARDRGAAPFDVAVLDTRTGTHRVLLEGVSPRYVEGGYIVYATEDGTLMASRFDLDRLSVVGDPIAIANGVAIWNLGRADVAMAQNGTLAYVAGPSIGLDRELVWVSRTGVVTPVDSGWTAPIRGLPALSPDGRAVAFALQKGRSTEVWIKALNDGPLSKFADRGASPTWSPDGREVAFWVPGGYAFGPADGSVLPRVKYPRTDVWQNLEISRDGQWIVGHAGGNIVAMRTNGDSALVPLLTTAALERRGTLSPDSRWLAYESDEGGMLQVYVRPFPDTERTKRQVSVRGGMAPRWSRDGRELYFIDPESGTLVAVPVTLAPMFSTGQPQSLFPIPLSSAYDVRADGRFLVSRATINRERTAPDLVIVTNFAAELRARVP